MMTNWRVNARPSNWGYMPRRCDCCGQWVSMVLDVGVNRSSFSMCFGCAGNFTVELAKGLEVIQQRFPELPVVKVRDVSEGGQ